MPRYVYRPEHPQADKHGMVPAEIAGPRYVSDAAPHVISDIMDSTRHMANGQFYDSKSRFRQATKDAGCVEVGNELATVTKPRKQIPLSREQRRDAIRQSIRQLQGR